MEEKLTRRQRRLLKRQEREKAQVQAGAKRAPVGAIVGIIIAALVVVGGGYAIWNAGKNAPSAGRTNKSTTTYTDAPVHWHAAFEVELCGKKQDFSSYGGAGHHAGLPLLHTHGDGVIHIEGRIIEKQDIALGRFFDAIDVPFDRDRIMDKKNGDECSPGKPGQVKMFVNGEPNTEFRDFVGKYTEKGEDTQIRIVFE